MWLCQSKERDWKDKRKDILSSSLQKKYNSQFSRSLIIRSLTTIIKITNINYEICFINLVGDININNIYFKLVKCKLVWPAHNPIIIFFYYLDVEKHGNHQRNLVVAGG